MQSNIPQSIKNKIGMNLHNKKGHPIKIIKEYIYKYFDSLTEIKFEKYDNYNPYVDIKYNFDALRIPKEHPSRKITDTYYLNENIVLRTHTSAHQYELLEKGSKSFLVTGDVYRKDEIDSNHYPVFHQLEGVHLCEDNKNPEEELKKILSGLITYLFPNCEYRFNKDYFPFTHPSYEIEVNFHGKWLEVLGCGVVHEEILNNLKIKQKGWAFGLGLERLAMILFDIIDIRLFWTDDNRFLEQFEEEKIVKFKQYPKLKAVLKDISFWIDTSEVTCEEKTNTFVWHNINNFYEIIREECGDLIEKVELCDNFYHPKHKKYSVMFRLAITPTEKDITITDPAILSKSSNKLMESLRYKLNNNGYICR
jgi:phenylalanyl-tRNA synthetase alpha chain